MGVWDFIKRKRDRHPFADRVNGLEGVSTVYRGAHRVIGLHKEVSHEVIAQLLALLRERQMSFSVYDPLYPSPSEPGAYMAYRPEPDTAAPAWSMTLGNHGWSGGIYTIKERNMVLQLGHLVRLGLIDSIGIDDVSFFAHYDKVYPDRNYNENARLVGLHGDIRQLCVDHLIFGSFVSDSWSSYYLYKLTADELLVDKNETWHSQRHSRHGYVFKGARLPEEQQALAAPLLHTIPAGLLDGTWSGFYTTGGKEEDRLVLAFGNDDFYRTISINSYETETEDLPEAIRDYRLEVERIIAILDR